MPKYDINDHAHACETRLPKGGTEIGIYIDEVVEGEGRILVGVITHPAGGTKWWWNGPNWTRKWFRTKRAALEEADRASRKTDAYKEIERQINYMETKDDWKWENIAENH